MNEVPLQLIHAGIAIVPPQLRVPQGHGGIKTSLLVMGVKQDRIHEGSWVGEKYFNLFWRTDTGIP